MSTLRRFPHRPRRSFHSQVFLRGSTEKLRPEPSRARRNPRCQLPVIIARSTIDASASKAGARQRGFNDLPLGHSGPRWLPHAPPPRMPRHHPILIAAAARLARAREIVANQRSLIARLRAAGRSTEDAEKTLQMYESSLRHLEEQERKLREEFRRQRKGYDSN
jgi:hypothetical protein